MKRKTCLIFLFVFLLVFASAIVFYRKTYPIANLNTTTLEQITNTYVSRKATAKDHVKYLGTNIIIDNMEFYLALINDQYGYVSYEQGPFGGHKLRHAAYGSSTFRNGIIESAGKKYLLFIDFNIYSKINTFAVEIQGYTYNLKAGDSHPFITSCVVDQSLPTGYVGIENFIFYDSTGANITDSVLSSCSNIS